MGRRAPSNHAGDERAIRQLNVEVLKAYNLGDVKTLDRIEDADFTLTRRVRRGRQGKAN